MSHSADGCCTVYTNECVTARKAHVCCACGEGIAPGHRYHRITTIFERELNTFKRCLRCEYIHAHLVSLCDKHTYGECWPDERLNCGEDYQENWGEAPPEEIAALAFVSGADLQAAATQAKLPQREATPTPQPATPAEGTT
jgi:hypothetical protein